MVSLQLNWSVWHGDGNILKNSNADTQAYVPAPNDDSVDDKNVLLDTEVRKILLWDRKAEGGFPGMNSSARSLGDLSEQVPCRNQNPKTARERSYPTGTGSGAFR